MSEPYLVAHVVRGKPAFDIAQRIDCCVCRADPEVVNFVVPKTEDCHECMGLGYVWQIPTSGHSAYPYWNWELRQATTNDEGSLIDEVPLPPPNWPDHYTTHAAPGQGLISNLAERLGLISCGRITRR